jgi:hypothetical protein
MTQGSNAGIKRIRRARGLPVVERKVRQIPSTAAAFDEACRASGDLSLSLYLERLATALIAERGSLPVLTPTLDGAEVRTTDAA